MVICMERGADLYIAQLMPLPLTVSCFSKIQIGVTFLVPAHPGSHGKRAVKRVCVCVSVSNTAMSLIVYRTHICIKQRIILITIMAGQCHNVSLHTAVDSPYPPRLPGHHHLRVCWVTIASCAKTEPIQMSFGARTRVGKETNIRWGPGSLTAEWLACWTQAQKGLESNRSRNAVG